MAIKLSDDIRVKRAVDACITKHQLSPYLRTCAAGFKHAVSIDYGTADLEEVGLAFDAVSLWQLPYHAPS